MAPHFWGAIFVFWQSFKFGLLEMLSLLAEPPIYFKPSSVIA
jgi:hypothetical protein